MSHPSRYSVTLTPDDLKGRVVYAVGDIHGRLDCLKALISRIKEDAGGRRPLLITMGDYADRGPETAGVIELLSQPIDGLDVISLMGNHDLWLLQALEGHPEASDIYLSSASTRPTLASYGIHLPLTDIVSMSHKALIAAREHLSRQLRAAVPARHRDWLASRPLRAETPGAHFVHAGFYPCIPLRYQDPMDMIWVRDEFLFSGEDFGKPVYHGHTIFDAPQDHGFRVGLDTGAFGSGILTAARLGPDGRPERYLVGAAGIKAAPIFLYACPGEDRSMGDLSEHDIRLWADWAMQVVSASPGRRAEVASDDPSVIRALLKELDRSDLPSFGVGTASVQSLVLEMLAFDNEPVILRDGERQGTPWRAFMVSAASRSEIERRQKVLIDEWNAMPGAVDDMEVAVQQRPGV